MKKSTLLAALCAIAPFAQAIAQDVPLDLKGVANMGFRDETPGDGKGGWSDQGPENDFASFDFKRSNYEGVDFSILDPAKNGGKAVLTFDSPNARTGLSSCEIPLPKERPSGRFLYLLHTSCWNGEPRGATIGFLEVLFKDGSGIQKTVKAGIDVANWWNPGSLANGKVVAKRLNKSAEVGVFLSKFELASKDKEIESIKFSSAGKVVWIVLGATVSSKNMPIEDPGIVYAPSETWKAVDMSDIQVKAGSALDLSSWLEPGPAGRHGRAVVGKNGCLAFEDSPETPRRLLGFNGFWFIIGELEREPSDIPKFAELVRRQGYDIVRPLCLEGYVMRGAERDGVPNPAKLEIADKLLSELKKQGVYTWLSVGAYGLGFKKGRPLKESAIQMAQMYLGDETVRANWKALTEAMLKHVNPYTGLAWKDDPAILCVEFYNEQDGGFRWPASSQIAEYANPVWRKWLAKRYASPDALAKAWGEKIESFEMAEIPPSWNGSSAKLNDYGLFWRDLQIEEAAWCERVVREAGYKGLVSQNNVSVNLNESAARWAFAPIADMHAYFSHPSGFSNPGSRCGQSSSVGSSCPSWRGLASSKLSGRPFFVTEHNHGFWNPYQHEEGIVFGAYSALQGFAETTVHEDAVALSAKGLNCDFSVAVSPVGRANELVNFMLFRRGDVRQALRSIELAIDSEYLDSACHGIKAVNTAQSQIGLVSGFSVAFPTLKPHWQVSPDAKKPDLVIGPASGAESEGYAWFLSVKDGKPGDFSSAAFFKALKARGLLDASNATDPDNGVFQSDTGEIVLRSKEKLLKVVTSRSEAVALTAGARETLGSFSVESSSADACVALSSLDGKPLSESGRMILVYSTEIVNSGMELSSDRATLLKLGSNPPLMRVGLLNASLKNSNASKLALYALGFDGSRREKLPLDFLDSGTKISFDSGKLKNGPTPFFELVAE